MKRNSNSGIVLATRNKGKVAELAVLLQPFGVAVAGLDAFPAVGEIEESGATFAENALLKARTASEITGLVAVADDSGLEVDALDGTPGVHSARYSEERDRPATDERNIAKVLAAMRGVPDEKRSVRFRSVMAAVAPNGQRIVAEGVWEGCLAHVPAGTNGFGYDPVFFDPVCGKTAAEMTASEKNSRSHRGMACRELLRLWPKFWSDAGEG